MGMGIRMEMVAARTRMLHGFFIVRVNFEVSLFMGCGSPCLPFFRICLFGGFLAGFWAIS